ncbi:hypothetical protein AX14_000658 [Amanita brunnescens Koide BX004]|nr:hypothetical protein AX14_000658 [Amanita brunnescens Koide BX004]
MGSVISAIGHAVNSIISGIASLIMAIIDGIVCVVGTTMDVIVDILCCRLCCGGSHRLGSRRWGRRNVL